MHAEGQVFKPLKGALLLSHAPFLPCTILISISLELRTRLRNKILDSFGHCAIQHRRSKISARMSQTCHPSVLGWQLNCLARQGSRCNCQVRRQQNAAYEAGNQYSCKIHDHLDHCPSVSRIDPKAIQQQWQYRAYDN
eukprot:6176342-Pleurochrysis_carterae.AAC.2